MMKSLIFCLAVCLFFSCKESTPKDVIPKDKMMLVLWDYMEANVYSFEQLRDSLQEDSVVNAKMQSNIFKKYKISREEFENSYSYYSKNAQLLKSMVDSILEKKQRIDTTGIITKEITPIEGL